jgi:hypothetical protein
MRFALLARRVADAFAAVLRQIESRVTSHETQTKQIEPHRDDAASGIGQQQLRRARHALGQIRVRAVAFLTPPQRYIVERNETKKHETSEIVYRLTSSNRRSCTDSNRRKPVRNERNITLGLPTS